MNTVEQAVYAAAFVDAFREMFCDYPLIERRLRALAEAELVLTQFRLAVKEAT